MTRVRDRLRAVPLVGQALMAAKSAGSRLLFPGSAAYWERRYARGGTSGPGSKGSLAAFKAEVVNAFVREHNVESVIEFGCGDGKQLALAEYPAYVGLDVSKSAIQLCRARFATDATKSFFLYDPLAFIDRLGLFRADLALSLDVIFHLVEDEVFETYLAQLFAAARRFVMVYTKDTDEPATVGYVRNRLFTPWIREHMPDWELADRIPNRYPWKGDVHTGSKCDFFVFQPTSQANTQFSSVDLRSRHDGRPGRSIYVPD